MRGDRLLKKQADKHTHRDRELERQKALYCDFTSKYFLLISGFSKQMGEDDKKSYDCENSLKQKLISTLKKKQPIFYYLRQIIDKGDDNSIFILYLSQKALLLNWDYRVIRYNDKIKLYSTIPYRVTTDQNVLHHAKKH